MRYTLEEKKKKQLISLLLFISCVISALLLLFTSGSSILPLPTTEHADSLIVHDLNKFNIAADQIKVRSIQVDSTYTRKTYHVAVPAGLSKTQLHLELAQSFSPYDISTPAKVIFPQKDMLIHLVHHNTVFRSIELTTDPDLVIKRNYGSILVAFDSAPSEALLEKVISFGEPLPLALIVRSPMEANELRNRLKDRYSNLLFWLKDESGDNVLHPGFPRIQPRLQHLQEALPNASVLSFAGLRQESPSAYIQILSKTSLTFIDASEAVMLDSDAGQATFKQELNKFVQKARRNEHPIAIVRGDSESLNWLQQELAGLKKTGLDIVLPRRKQF